MKYYFKEIEKKWQEYWKENKSFKAETHCQKPKYYVLDMFPYPSGAGLHVGHPLGYIASDIVARYKRHQGYNVLHPMGYDSFGLPAEQYAINTGQHPAITTKQNTDRYRSQLDQIGFSFDWSREIKTSSPKFYKWTQWIFLQLFHHYYCQKTDKAQHISNLVAHFEKHGSSNSKAYSNSFKNTFSSVDWNKYSTEQKQKILLHFRLTYIAEATVNWCPGLGSVLANDEVINGVSERGGYPVVQKKMKQWMMRITAYSERLLEGLQNIDWPESLKETQRHWIGKSHGARIYFEIENSEERIEVFTTRPDTIFGVSFITLAPEHTLVEEITSNSQRDAIEEYKEKTSKKSERERKANNKEISGVWTGGYAIHPLTKERLQIWIGEFVLVNYGTGAVMSVPCGDERDFAFAKHFNLSIPNIFKKIDISDQAYMGKDAILQNSDFLNGMHFRDAMKTILHEIRKKNIGEKIVNYRLRDAVFSRQRYWGEPVPVYFKGEVPCPLDEKELPLELPDIEEYLPTENGAPPLGRSRKWAWSEKENKVVENIHIDQKNVFPLEMNTMPGWAGSSWYFNRYMDAGNTTEFASKKSLEYWKEIDLYIGGSEHSTGHLLYSRFWQHFLYDIGKVPVQEYAKKLVNQGMILGNSAIIHRVRGENTYVSADIASGYETDKIRVDVNLVDLQDILDVNTLKVNYSSFADADFVFSNDIFIVERSVEKMSKRWLNVINPDDICETYGADTLRMYEMFMGPLELTKPWNTKGLVGVLSFLKKFWKLYHLSGNFNTSDEPPSKVEFRILHKTIQKITEDIENITLNTSVSAFMIAVNELTQLKCNKKDILEPMVILISPFAPHIAEELWQKLGNESSICHVPFPMYDLDYLKEEHKRYPVSINGKMRFTIEYPSEWDKNTIEKSILQEERLQKYIEGKQIKKIIIVPGKIINFVLR